VDNPHPCNEDFPSWYPSLISMNKFLHSGCVWFWVKVGQPWNGG
jgi:hypothetical protein